jgi:hypothetical protein
MRMRKIAVILALALAPSVCPAGNDTALFNTLNAGIDEGLATLQAQLPLNFGPGMTVTGARREDRTIIYTMNFHPPEGGWWSPKVVDIMRASLTRRVCSENGKSWFDLGYVTQYSVWDRDRFIADVIVDKAACGY